MGVLRAALERGVQLALAALLFILPVNSGASTAGGPAPAGSDTVVLLHGLARSARSMRPLERALAAAGYRVCNIDYPSTQHAIEDLSERHVLPALAACAGDQPVHFVTHSMGGIIVRYLASLDAAPAIGRVVMLGPPNAGSEVVDKIGSWRAFDWVNGPAGRQLGTGAGSLPKQLGPAQFTVGIIAGRRSINWINSTMIPGADDGKVSVASARLAGMSDFRVLPVTHPMMMRNRQVIAEVVYFLREGKFQVSATVR
ncbi:MAG: alpha/beta fold hydrolase [Pseudomonadota bacterium]